MEEKEKLNNESKEKPKKASLRSRILGAIKRSRLGKLFYEMFEFEQGVDLSDEVQVLYRRNVVIKNIIFFSNLMYTIIFAIVSIGEGTTSNIVLTIILFPVTYLVNKMLKSMIYTNPNELVKQKMASYVAVGYMFLSSILVYIKLKNRFTTENEIAQYSEVGYILLYYSLVIVSFYQDKNLLKTVCKFLLVIVTIIHFTITYPIINADYARQGFKAFMVGFFTSEDFRDIFLRTIILCLFMIVLYAIVSISEYLQDERKKELVKRVEVEDEFKDIVTEMFKSSLSNYYISESEKEDSKLIAKMSKKLAGVLGLKPSECDELYDYATCHIDYDVNFDLDNNLDKDLEFNTLKENASVGNRVVTRLNLRRRAQELVSANENGWADEDFNLKMCENKLDDFSQIVVICDLYIRLRNADQAKRPYPHERVIELLQDKYRIYFDNRVIERFIRFQDEFDLIYENSLED